MTPKDHSKLLQTIATAQKVARDKEYDRAIQYMRDAARIIKGK